jgi:hypothetical protein
MELANYENKKGFKLLQSNTWMHLVNILSIYSKIKIISDNNSTFIEILFGFFQCKIIKKCEMLSFLELEYVLAHSNSIILSKIR